MSNSGGRFYVKQKNVPDGICLSTILYHTGFIQKMEDGGGGGGGGGGGDERRK